MLPPILNILKIFYLKFKMKEIKTDKSKMPSQFLNIKYCQGTTLMAR